MDWIEFFERVAVPAAAVYGAALSTWNAIAEIRERSPRVQVRCGIGFAPDPRGRGAASLVTTSATNVGQRAVKVTGFGFRLPDRKVYTHLRPRTGKPLPALLSPGDRLDLALNAGEMARSLRDKGLRGQIRLTPFVTDAAGRTYRGRPLVFDVAKWADEP